MRIRNGLGVSGRGKPCEDLKEKRGEIITVPLIRSLNGKCGTRRKCRGHMKGLKGSVRNTERQPKGSRKS